MPVKKTPVSTSKRKATPKNLGSKKVTQKRATAKSDSSRWTRRVLSAKPTRVKTGPSPGFPIVGIGASAGGLEAFQAFLKAMPADSGMAFVVSSHLDPSHVSILPELLQKSTRMKVEQVKDGVRARPNQVYVIPPNRNLSILGGALQLMDFPNPRTSNLPIDNFYRDLAKDQGSNAVCITLSGTGTDGTLGLGANKGLRSIITRLRPVMRLLLCLGLICELTDCPVTTPGQRSLNS